MLCTGGVGSPHTCWEWRHAGPPITAATGGGSSLTPATRLDASIATSVSSSTARKSRRTAVPLGDSAGVRLPRRKPPEPGLVSRVSVAAEHGWVMLSGDRVQPETDDAWTRNERE